MVSSTLGSPANTGWKRRASAASFSMCFRYSSSVVAPMQRSSPRASAGLSMLLASMRALGRARTDQRVQLVDEQDDAALRALDLLEHRLEPLLELAAELGAGHHGAPGRATSRRLSFRRLGHVALGDALARGPRRWRSCPRRARRSAPGCSWCGATAPASRGGSPRRGRSPGRSCPPWPALVMSRVYFSSAWYLPSGSWSVTRWRAAHFFDGLLAAWRRVSPSLLSSLAMSSSAPIMANSTCSAEVYSSLSFSVCVQASVMMRVSRRERPGSAPPLTLGSLPSAACSCAVSAFASTPGLLHDGRRPPRPEVPGALPKGAQE